MTFNRDHPPTEATEPSVPGPTSVGVPAAGDYRIDPESSAVAFTTRHLFGLAAVQGSFHLHDGHIHVADPTQESWTRAAISAASVQTGNPNRDASIRSPRLLATADHPDITFTSSRLGQTDGHWVLHGDLSVRGMSRPIQVHIDDVHAGETRIRLHATARVDRHAFGITRYRGLAARHLTLRLDVIADRT
ncbi:YceI family protein [Actinomadura rudentiformis]|nr:YceI family protein [Actinomadura rudentiformis]